MGKLLATMAIAAAVAVAGAQAHAETVTLKFAGFGSGKSPFYTRAINPFIKRVEELTHGAVKIELFINTLGTPTELYENAANGVADISWVTAAAQRGFKFPRSEVLSLPLIGKGYSVQQESVAMWRLYKKGLIAGDYKEVFPIAFASMSQVHLISKGMQFSPQSIRGKKVAVPDGKVAQAVGAIGGVPIFTQYTDLNQSLARGTVDALAVGFTAVLSIHLMDVSDTHTVVPLGSPLVFIGMNRKKFESLSQSGQKAILQASGETLSRNLGAAGDAFIGMTRKALAAHPKQKVVEFSPAQLKAWQSGLQPIVDKWVADTPNGAAILKTYRAELARTKSQK